MSSMSSVVDCSSNFIIKVQKESAFYRNPECRHEGESLYEQLVQQLSSREYEEYDHAVCIIFALLRELKQRNVPLTASYQELSGRAISVIHSAQGREIDSHLARFLEQQSAFFSEDQ